MMLQFSEFVQQFGRDYLVGSAEYIRRESIFLENVAFVNEHNKAFSSGHSSWSAALNEFADMDESERMAFKGYKPSPADVGQRMRMASSPKSPKTPGVDLPLHMDWRDMDGKSFVSPPKNQASCGSCWAHAAVETIESHAAINLNVSVMELSPQQFVDCIQNPDQCGGTGGCEGATAELAFNYSLNGVALNKDYKYTGRDGACKVEQPAVSVGSYVQLPMNDAAALLEAVATVGPISISVAAASWSFYSSGVFDGKHGNGCDVEVDHAVQLVGYGTDDSTGKDYWLVRNSWGPSWGEKGYIRIQRNPGNEPCAVDTKPLDGVCGKTGECACGPTVQYCGVCAILSDSSYPTELSMPAN